MNPFTLPNLPTDNLYKFYSIAGIVIFLSSFTFLILQSNSSGKQLDSLKMESAILAREVAFVKEDQRLFKSKYQNISILRADSYIDSEVTEDKKESLRLKLLETSRELEIKLVQLNSKTEILSSKVKEFWLVLILGSLLMFFGINLTNKGFKSWKAKVQDLVDEKLEIELKLLRKQLNEKK